MKSFLSGKGVTCCCCLPTLSLHIGETNCCCRPQYTGLEKKDGIRAPLGAEDNCARDLWSEVRKVKGRNSKISSNVDGSCDSKEITELFSEKFKHLYNSVLYNIDDMHAIESTIFERLHNCENVNYVISHNYVINTVSHLNNGKSDGSEDFF